MYLLAYVQVGDLKRIVTFVKEVQQMTIIDKVLLILNIFFLLSGPKVPLLLPVPDR